MTKEILPFSDVKEKIEQAQSITILSHLNPDADTLGTALGIYTLLTQEKGKRVEVVNASSFLPKYLDFLPNFQKIKQKMDYTDSLIITCDCANVKRLGFDIADRDILNIDHHKSNTLYGTINVILSNYASASQVAYRLFDTLYKIDAKVATCFYAALLSDTKYFTTISVNEEVFLVAQSLVQKGAKPEDIAYHFTQRRSLASVRILEKALSTLKLYNEAKIAVLHVTKVYILESGATVPDMEGIVEYGLSLATVEIALFVMELEEGLRISLRSKKVDVSSVAVAFAGGGHKVASGFTMQQSNLQESIDTILEKINELGLLI